MYSYLCHGLRARARERDRSSYNKLEEKRRRLVSREFASFLTAKAPRTRPLLHSSRIVVMAPKLVDGVRYYVSSSFLFDRRVLLDARCVTSL